MMYFITIINFVLREIDEKLSIFIVWSFKIGRKTSSIDLIFRHVKEVSRGYLPEYTVLSANNASFLRAKRSEA